MQGATGVGEVVVMDRALTILELVWEPIFLNNFYFSKGK
jgi:hypothetical protein